MRTLGTLFLTALLLSAGAASAFSTDDQTLTDKSGAPKFSDPDDQLPSPIFMPTGSANFGQQGSDDAQTPSNYQPSAAAFSPANSYALPRH